MNQITALYAIHELMDYTREKAEEIQEGIEEEMEEEEPDYEELYKEALKGKAVWKVVAKYWEDRTEEENIKFWIAQTFVIIETIIIGLFIGGIL